MKKVYLIISLILLFITGNAQDRISDRLFIFKIRRPTP